MQECNIICLPENYTQKYYNYHALTWPKLSFVARDITNNRIAGYVMGKVDDTNEETLKKQERGHITSLAVHRDYRKLGIAKKLMDAVHYSMKTIYELIQVSLHVRITNKAGLGLYKDKLNYKQISIDKEYYADNEDALFLVKEL